MSSKGLLADGGVCIAAQIMSHCLHRIPRRQAKHTWFHKSAIDEYIGRFTTLDSWSRLAGGLCWNFLWGKLQLGISTGRGTVQAYYHCRQAPIATLLKIT